MKIGYISDLHVDFYVRNTNENSIKKFIKRYLKPEGGDILIIAGDISHYNKQIEMTLEELSNYYNFIVFVLGNHEMYLVSRSQREKYNYMSSRRIEEIEEWSFRQKNIFLLNGSTININGIKIGGLMNWYYLKDDEINFWRKESNDSRLIFEGPHYIFRDMYSSYKLSSFNSNKFKKEQDRLFKKIKNIHILVTHVCPIIIVKNDKIAAFYHSNNLSDLLNSGARYVIYGHYHKQEEFVYNNISFKINALGYPSEEGCSGIKHFNLEEDLL